MHPLPGRLLPGRLYHLPPLRRKKRNCPCRFAIQKDHLRMASSSVSQFAHVLQCTLLCYFIAEKALPDIGPILGRWRCKCRSHVGLRRSIRRLICTNSRQSLGSSCAIYEQYSHAARCKHCDSTHHLFFHFIVDLHFRRFSSGRYQTISTPDGHDNSSLRTPSSGLICHSNAPTRGGVNAAR